MACMVGSMTMQTSGGAGPRRAYLDELKNYESTTGSTGFEDETVRRFEVQNARYGFDERQTWSLDHAMVETLYERLRMFQDLNHWTQTEGPVIAQFEGKSLTKGSAIAELLRLAELVLTTHGDPMAREAAAEQLWKLWVAVHPHMWS